MKPAHLAIAQLLGNPHLTQAKIAQLTDSSEATVKRVNARLKQITGGTDQEIAAYRKLVRKRLTDETAVDVLEGVLSSWKTNPFAGLKALEYRDRILEVAPKRNEVDAAPNQAGPVVVFQQGGRIDFGAAGRRAIGDGSGESE